MLGARNFCFAKICVIFSACGESGGGERFSKRRTIVDGGLELEVEVVCRREGQKEDEDEDGPGSEGEKWTFFSAVVAPSGSFAIVSTCCSAKIFAILETFFGAKNRFFALRTVGHLHLLITQPSFQVNRRPKADFSAREKASGVSSRP